MARAVIIVCLALASIGLTASPAYADLYYVSATDGPLESAAGRQRGVRADSWVLFDPHQVYSLHLNSVYMWLDSGSYVEAGWAWYAGDGPQAYVAYERNGVTSDQEREWLGPVRPGSYLGLSVVNAGRDASGAVRWECRVGDQRAVVVQDFDRATARISSERQTYRDSDYGRFRGIRVLDRDGGWRPPRDIHIQNGDQDYDGAVMGDAFLVH